MNTLSNCTILKDGEEIDVDVLFECTFEDCGSNVEIVVASDSEGDDVDLTQEQEEDLIAQILERHSDIEEVD